MSWASSVVESLAWSCRFGRADVLLAEAGIPYEDSSRTAVTIHPYFMGIRSRLRTFVLLALVFSPLPLFAADAPVDLGKITEKHATIPMRDGKHLSAWLYFPAGTGPWPVIFEQRYADIHGAGSRKAAAKFAEGGFVIALVN